MIYWSQINDADSWTIPTGKFFCEWPLRRHRIVIYPDNHIEAVNWRKAKRLVGKSTAKIVTLDINSR